MVILFKYHTTGNIITPASFFSSSSSDTPFVSGTFVNTHISCNTIIKGKKCKYGPGIIFKKSHDLYQEKPCDKCNDTGEYPMDTGPK